MNTEVKVWSLMSATLVSGLLMSGTVNASVISCADKPDGNNYMDVPAEKATACLDSGVGNLQGENEVKDPFLSGIGSDYSFIEKYEGDAEDQNLDFNPYYTEKEVAKTTEGKDKATGTWGFDSSVWSSYGTIALGFKFGGGGDPDNYFVYQLAPEVSSGDWSYWADKGHGLSHMNIYGTDSVSVPEPGTLALLGLGIVGLSLAHRKAGTS